VPARHGEPAAAVNGQAVSGQPAAGAPARSAEAEPFDLIYLDPPWPAGLHAALSEAVIRGGWITPGGTLVWECPSEEIPPLPAGWRLRDRRRYGGSSVVLLQPLDEGMGPPGGRV
jgi:16S rRNA G966 N2-methylase RsmD